MQYTYAYSSYFYYISFCVVSFCVVRTWDNFPISFHYRTMDDCAMTKNYLIFLCNNHTHSFFDRSIREQPGNYPKDIWHAGMFDNQGSKPATFQLVYDLLYLWSYSSYHDGVRSSVAVEFHMLGRYRSQLPHRRQKICLWHYLNLSSWKQSKNVCNSSMGHETV